jgi:hypothetical protein
MPSKEFECLFIINGQFYKLKVDLTTAEQKSVKSAAFWDITATVTTSEGQTETDLRTPTEWHKPVVRFTLASASAGTKIAAGQLPLQLSGSPQVENAELLGAVPGVELPAGMTPTNQAGQVSFAEDF